MGKFDGILICTDFDGTFAMTGPAVSPENAAAVKYYQENGGLFTIASGRSADFVLSFPEFRPNAPIVACNGTMICDPETGERIMTFPLTDDITEVMDEAEKTGLIHRVHICNNDGHASVWQASDGITLQEFYASVPKPWYKILFEQSVENTQKMKEWSDTTWAGKYVYTRSWSAGIEFQPMGTGKGECFDHLKKLIGNVRLTVGAGDYENDITLIRCADIGYAVENAVDEAKAAANRITVSHNDHAIARIIEDLDKEFAI